MTWSHGPPVNCPQRNLLETFKRFLLIFSPKEFRNFFPKLSKIRISGADYGRCLCTANGRWQLLNPPPSPYQRQNKWSTKTTENPHFVVNNSLSKSKSSSWLESFPIARCHQEDVTGRFVDDLTAVSFTDYLNHDERGNLATSWCTSNIHGMVYGYPQDEVSYLAHNNSFKVATKAYEYLR